MIIILLAVLGAAFGSFFNVLIYRLPRKQSIVYPPSHCGDCNKPIPFYLNIPIVSYIMLRGKCKYCGASIHWHHFLVEAITPLILILLFLQYGYQGQFMLFLKYSVLCLFLIPIFFIDAFHQIIPHKLSIPLIPLGFIFALIPGSDITILESGIAAAIIFFFLLFIAYAYRFARKVDGLIEELDEAAEDEDLLISAVLGIIYFFIFVRNKEQGFAFGTFIAVTTILWSLLGSTQMLMNLRLL